MLLALPLVLFLIGWAVSIVGAHDGWPFLGPGVVGLLIFIYSLLRPRFAPTLRFAMLLGVVGTFLESLFISLGLYFPVDGSRGSMICPLWITMLWVLAALPIHDTFLPHLRRLAPAAATGAILFPLAYAGLIASKAILISLPAAQFLPLLALHGAILFPILLSIGRWSAFQGRSSEN